MYSLNYQHLRYFWAVSRHGNLTRASAELHLTPQTVSTQIRDLENGLGEKLFVRKGRGLVLTEIGQVVFGYADEIFNLGQELQDEVRGLPGRRPVRLSIGVADVVPKFIAHHLIEPAFLLEEPVHVVCREGSLEKLLADLAIYKLDVVLSDSPTPTGVKIKAYNHLIGKCGVVFMACGEWADDLRDGFPDSLNGAPFLVPVRGTSLRRKLDEWFDKRSIRPVIVGEFEDSALLKAFGQTGVGIFAIPDVIENEVKRQYKANTIAAADGITESFYVISVERKIKHPAVSAICHAGRSSLFTNFIA